MLRIPNLAIHFTRVYEKFEFNLETNLRPLFATEHATKLAPFELGAESDIATHQHSAIVKLVAEDIKVDPGCIVDMDLNILDAQPGSFLGVHKEFISAPRLDNQLSCHCGTEAFVDLHTKTEFLKGDGDINVFVMFDHEEIGSKSPQGALSNFLMEITKRIFERTMCSPEAEEYYKASLRRSFLVSADTAHATNPNYADKHQEVHPVKMHGVIYT